MFVFGKYKSLYGISNEPFYARNKKRIYEIKFMKHYMVLSAILTTCLNAILSGFRFMYLTVYNRIKRKESFNPHLHRFSHIHKTTGFRIHSNFRTKMDRARSLTSRLDNSMVHKYISENQLHKPRYPKELDSSENHKAPQNASLSLTTNTFLPGSTEHQSN